METWSKRVWKIIGIAFIVINICITAVISFAVNSISAREQTLQGVVQNAASIEYVNKGDSALNDLLCRQDEKIEKKADKTDLDKMEAQWTERFNRIETKTDDSYKMLVEILKTVKGLQ